MSIVISFCSTVSLPVKSEPSWATTRRTARSSLIPASFASSTLLPLPHGSGENLG